ncbi:MAG: PAS domain S-box protein [Bacteroidetes bacterium]|nr:PAS domain S-box protein [Bacteroidota bacterium]
MREVNGSAFEMFAFFERTPVLVCISRKDGLLRKVNPAVPEKLGYSEEELFAKPISSLIYHEDKLMTEVERGKLLQGKNLINFQNRYVTKKGNIIWLQWTSVYFPEKELVFAIAQDISEKKQAEKEIEDKYAKFKSLATHFKTKIEEDRKYLAVELHEELAQLASVVKMDIDMLNNSRHLLPVQAQKRIDHALIVTDLLINTIRRISFSVSPQMLEEVGLDETLKWHCNEFAVLNGIACNFKSNYDESILTREVKLDFFRICQEALSNVMYHAQAEHVEINIQDTGDTIRLAITDNGKGFDTIKDKKSSGLINMRERAASINGKLCVDSQPGKGTRILVEIVKN